jgi:hypothetical protein
MHADVGKACTAASKAPRLRGIIHRSVQFATTGKGTGFGGSFRASGVACVFGKVLELGRRSVIVLSDPHGKTGRQIEPIGHFSADFR